MLTQALTKRSSMRLTDSEGEAVAEGEAEGEAEGWEGSKAQLAAAPCLPK
jgi:hypothetical protein